MASHLVAMQTSGLEAFWPSNAVVLATCLLFARDRRDLLAIGGGQMIGGVALHLARADPWSIVLLLSAANVTESLLAYLLLRTMGVRHGLVDRVGNFVALVLACGTVGILSSTIGGIGLWIGRDVPFWDGWRSWYVSGVLSALLVTPSILVVAELLRGYRSRTSNIWSLIEAGGLFTLIAAATVFVFYAHAGPTIFLVSPCVLFVTFRFRAIGAVGAVVIVTTIAAWATASGHGPIAEFLHRPGDQVLVLQVFVAATLLSALPVAAVLNERDHKAAETRAFAEHFQSVVENIGEVIFRIDPQACWSYLNPAWATLTGRSIGTSIGGSWLDLFEREAHADLRERVAAVLRGEESGLRRVVRLGTPHGLRWVELFLQGLPDRDGRISGATGTLRDIDDRKRLEDHVLTAKQRAEQRAREATLLATTDELTGLANRRAFMGQLDREIAAAAEFDWPLAVAMFDVDHFKLVNDRHGHVVGDRVLQSIATRAASVVRSGDLIGRLGGEEFGILMPGTSQEEAARIAERLRAAMEKTPAAGDVLPGVTISIGIAGRGEQRTAGELLAVADTALYAAKSDGRNRVRIAA